MQKNVGDKQPENEKKTRNVVSLISQGQVSKAANRISSFGVADIGSNQVMEQVKLKYPDRGRPLPEMVTFGRPVDS